MKLSDYVINFLIEQKVKHVFAYIGGAITHLADSLYENDNIKTVFPHHEQAAAFAAEAYARVNGNIGVAMATSGPGATNLITGIGSAYFDSVPCLYITGQVNTYEYKFDMPVRQIGFQETDIVSIVKPITKYAYMVTDAKEIKYVLQKAVSIAKTGRPGPVLIDIPMNIQRAEINVESLEEYLPEIKIPSKNKLSLDNNKDIIEKIKNAKRPVFLIGGGVRLANATQELLQVINKTNIPVVTSLMGLDAISHYNPSFCGMVGAYGNRYANFTVANCDLLVVIGSRLTSRQTSSNPETFAREADIIHIDIDAEELKRMDRFTLPVCCDAKEFLSFLYNNLDKYNRDSIKEWINLTEKYKERYPSFTKNDNSLDIKPNYFMNVLSQFLEPNDIICLDVGQNQMWAAQSLKLKENQRMLISGGMGAMGFSLPAAIGAYYSSPKSRVIAIMGDGGIQINIQELQTISRMGLPIKIILMNNNSLGMVRHFQEIYFNSNFHGTVIGYEAPCFSDISEAYNIEYYAINTEGDIDNKLNQALNTKRPALIEVKLPNITYVIPKLEMDRPIEDQSPLLDRNEFLSNMIVKPLDK